ncbi:hypothetical protein PTKIN_Ptkin14bG0169300 [Pterospermum kingtungense]
MANLHKSNDLLRSNLLSQLTSSIPSKDNSPTRYFEVTKPIKLPNTEPCSSRGLRHDFGFTYGRPPVLVNNTPPACYSQDFARIVLEGKATCKGRQFDRIFGVWLGGVELLRSCTAEPTSNGIVWSVEKDITSFFHEKDEFWYGNFPNDYIAANNLSNTPGNGPFREVVVSLDGEVVAAVCLLL